MTGNASPKTGGSSGRSGFFTQELALTALVLFFVIVLSWQNTFDYLNWKIFDTIVTMYRKTPEHRDNVVFVCIDQKSIDLFDRDLGIGWPWPREFHGRVVDYLAASGAKAVVFDVIFSEQDIDRDELSGEDSDANLARAINKSGITYLAVAGQDEDLVTERFNRDIRFYIDDPGPFGQVNDLPVYESAVFPIDSFAVGAHGLGLVNMQPEQDGIHRRYPLVSRLGNRYVPSLAFAVVKDILDGNTIRERIFDNVGKRTFIDSEGKFFLNWYGTGGTGRGRDDSDAVFMYYSYSAVLVSALNEEMGETPVISRDTFRDKIIIIGSNAPGLLDLKATPFTHENLYPGMEIHATAIENMLSGEFINFLPQWILIAVMVAISLILYSLERSFKSLRIFIAVYVIFMICELVAAYLFVVLRHQWISAVEIFGTTTFIFAGLVLSGYFKETREKRLLRQSFGRYVNETVLRDILADPTSVDFKGRTIIATIMATDIAGFTSISEKLPPYVVVARLNDYLSEVSEKLIDNGAYINKYIGDAILALYGAFGESDHRKKACYAALRAQEIINRKVEQAKASNEDPMVTRFGITTGEMTMGNIGSERKIEYTVIGDTVNTAFRLEGLNKFYRTTIIVSDQTYKEVGDDFEFRLLDILKVKGKETPEQVFELLGVKGEVPREKLMIRDEFEAALKLYQNRHFAEAKEEFSRLAAEGDQTSDVFDFRCKQFMEEPPPPDWNGIWVMLRK